MKTLKLFIVITSLLIVCGCDNKASVREVKQLMKTYAFSDPDPIVNPSSLYYPYYQFEGYTDVPEDKEWKVIEMENDYIKLYIFPEIGGKIWGAVEKSTGNEFIYYNHVVKFRHVAMRGPWTSGGVEFNYGIIGHAPTTSTPVDYTFRTNGDGSVSCFIGARELITNTEWCVEVKLEKDKGYFTTKTHWENTSPLAQPYYHWMNAGYKASDDLKFCFPGTNYIGHGGELHSWPVDEQGRKIDEYANNNFGEYKSYHVLGKYNNYYGAYYNNSSFGSVHYSPHDEKLGMKVWIWGLSRQGMIWEDLLTDNDGQYVELQSGRMFNQPGTTSMHTPFKHFAFEPYAVDKWTEYWYPVKSTKGMVESNRYGALNVTRENDYLKLYFCPTEKISSKIEITSNNKVIYSNVINADVLTTWVDSIKMDSYLTSIKVNIGDGLLVYSEYDKDNNLSRPLVIDNEFDWTSLYGLYTEGKQWLNLRDFEKAELFFNKCLDKDPLYAPALNNMAEISYRKADYLKAIKYATKSMGLNAYDPMANMIYGLANSKLNNNVDAKDGFAVASYSTSYRSAAYIELAKEYAKKQDWKQVKEYALKSITINSENISANQLLILANRKMGNNSEANKCIELILEKLPLSHSIRFEKSLISNNESDTKKFISSITNELPQETLLAIADWYEDINAYDEAMRVLSYAQNYPIAVYRQAYILNKLGKSDDALSKLSAANAMSPNLVTPHGLQTLAALQWAVSKQNVWTSLYYLALTEWSVGNKDKAIQLFTDCGNDVDYAPFYMCRAQLKQVDNQLADLKKSESIEKSWRVGLRLINYTYGQGLYNEAYQYAKEYLQLFPHNYYIGLKYAQTMLKQGAYIECIDYLHKLKVLPNEGAITGRYVYRDACLLQAVDMIAKKDYEGAIEFVEKSKIWLENLGVGKPYDEDIDQRAENYITAYCYKAIGKLHEAKAMYEKIVESKQSVSPNLMLTAFAYKYLSKTDAANKTFLDYQKASPSNYSYLNALFAKNKFNLREAHKGIGVAGEIAAWESQGERSYDINVVTAIAKNLTN